MKMTVFYVFVNVLYDGWCPVLDEVSGSAFYKDGAAARLVYDRKVSDGREVRLIEGRIVEQHGEHLLWPLML